MGFLTDASCVSPDLLWRLGGGIEPLHVSMPRELKSRPSTSLTHPGLTEFFFFWLGLLDTFAMASIAQW